MSEQDPTQDRSTPTDSDQNAEAAAPAKDDSLVIWQTVPFGMSEQQRRDLTKRFTAESERWVRYYNIGIEVVYWLTYSSCVLAMIIVFKDAPAYCSPLRTFEPSLGYSFWVVFISALAVVTIAYELLPETATPFGGQYDLLLSIAISLALYGISFYIGHLYETAAIHEISRAVEFSALIWLSSLWPRKYMFNVLYKLWLKRLIDAQPIQAILYGLGELLRVSRKAVADATVLGLSERSALVLDLDIAAQAIRRAFPSRFISRDSQLSSWIMEESELMAGALREFQQAIVCPDITDMVKIESKAISALRSVLEENWARFPRAMTALAVANASQREWSEVLKLVLVAILPCVGVGAIYWLDHVRNSQNQFLPESVLNWAILLTVAWCVINLLRAIAPDLDARISSFAAIISTLSPLSRQDMKKESRP